MPGTMDNNMIIESEKQLKLTWGKDMFIIGLISIDKINILLNDFR